ncbi:MAG: glycosyltransferase, partial [Bacteroidota bacterium]
MEDLADNKESGNRVLWLTDTFEDHNGVSMVLQAMHKEIVERHLPIDLLVCSNTLDSGKNLIVVKPVMEFTISLYPQQPFRIPNLLHIRSVFRKGKYKRVVSSTEGPMGLAAMYLRKAYSVKTFFYLHTDWVMFAKQAMSMEEAGLRRLQRMMRIYYNRFDGIFVLNSDQQKWLTGSLMKFDPGKVKLTAHWADIKLNDALPLQPQSVKSIQTPFTLLYAGRISREKGVFELPGIFRRVKEEFPLVRMKIVGKGPSEKELMELFPEAEFTGWVAHDTLPEQYSSA